MSAASVPVDPRPASTVVVLRDSSGGPEVFMVRRHESTAFMGGAHVFPGGRVDRLDHDGDESWCDGIDHAVRQLPDMARETAVAYHVAAARELFEEAGVLLAREPGGGVVSLAGDEARVRFKTYRGEVHSGRTPLHAILERERLRLALDALVLFAHWVTPPIVESRQFDTRFFMARMPPDQTPAHDETETTHSVWLTPQRAISEAIDGRIVLPPPTWTTLRELERFERVEDAIAWARRRRIHRCQQQLIEQDGVRMLVQPGDPLYRGEPPPAGAELVAETRFVFVDRHWRAERAGT